MKKPLQNILAIAVILMATSTSPLRSQCVTAMQTIGSGANQLDISMSVDGSINQVRFDITGPATAWFGFAFNTTTMSPGNYTILANVGGGNPAEYIMVNHAAPTLQPVQNLTSINGSTTSGRKTYTFYRALNTGDVNDFIFATMAGNLNIAWAYGNNLSLAYHGDRGGSSLSFTDPCINNAPIVLPTVTICQGDSAMILGQYQSISGLYTDTIPVPWGCDTIHEQTLIVQQGTVLYDTNRTMLCKGDSVMINGLWYHSAAQIPVFQTLQGCDSLYDLHIITQVNIDTTVITMGATLVATSGYQNYHWIDCNTGLTAAGSMNSHTYTPSVTGLYKVEITQEGCTTESACRVGGTIGIQTEKADPQVSFDLFPNPAVGHVRISVEKTDQKSSIQLFNSNGIMLMEALIQPGQTEADIDINHLSSGVYIIRLYIEGYATTPKRVIKI